jgi:hypothetical protein
MERIDSNLILNNCYSPDEQALNVKLINDELFNINVMLNYGGPIPGLLTKINDALQNYTCANVLTQTYTTYTGSCTTPPQTTINTNIFGKYMLDVNYKDVEYYSASTVIIVSSNINETKFFCPTQLHYNTGFGFEPLAWGEDNVDNCGYNTVGSYETTKYAYQYIPFQHNNIKRIYILSGNTTEITKIEQKNILQIDVLNELFLPVGNIKIVNLPHQNLSNESVENILITCDMGGLNNGIINLNLINKPLFLSENSKIAINRLLVKNWKINTRQEITPSKTKYII